MSACGYCDGPLVPKGYPCDRAWRCDTCGRLHLEGAVALDYPIPKPGVRQYRRQTRWPERLLKDLPLAVKAGLCTSEEAEPWLKRARSESRP